jgi:hypothetical protein
VAPEALLVVDGPARSQTAPARYVTEFIGAFGLVLTIGCVVPGESSLAPLAIGGVLAALVFAEGAPRVRTTTPLSAARRGLDGVARPGVRSAPVVECFFRITETERNARVLRRPRAEKRSPC